MGYEDFLDGYHGGHLGYRNGTILAIKNSYVDPMPSIKLNLTPRSGGDFV